MERPIGLFDSGVGGLTVLSKIKELLPNENIIYIGDNAHCPYGDKSMQELLVYTKAICDYFVKRNVKMIVLACNTTSANVLEELQKTYPQVKIIGVIHSTVNELLKHQYSSVLIIATHATIQSHKYKELIHRCNEQIEVYELETPALVPLIESGEYKNGIKDTLKQYLLPYQDKVESLILGCTHYPIIQQQISEVLCGKSYISSSDSICHEVYTYLSHCNLLNRSLCNGKVEVYTTGDVHEFRYSSEGFFDYRNIEVDHLDV